MSVPAEFTRTGGWPVLDLSGCATEPIHIPGSIQPHGAVLAALADELLVTHASANLPTILGRSVAEVLGRSLENAIGEAACRTLLDVGTSGGVASDRVHSLSLPDGRLLYVRAHQSGRHICVDIEPVHVDPMQRWPIFMARSAVKIFELAASVVELCELAVQELKAISGYDRVMAYRFYEDGHGEVIAEAREASLKAYLGQHYPASDIPRQARDLYLRQRVGAIADSSYKPVPLCADPALDDGMPLDLTHSALRSASPVHREYMRNMDTAASLTIGLAYGPELWGMLVCHHTQPRRAGFELRATADMIGQVVSLLLVSTGEAELLTQRLHRQASLRALTDRLNAPVPLEEAFAAAEAELLHLMDASGAVVCLYGTLRFFGRTPSRSATESALAMLKSSAEGEPLAVDDLWLRYPELAGSGEACGALLLPLASGDHDAILWFRPELVRTVVWAGNPTEHATPKKAAPRISPRTSFAAWKETVRGHCAPWNKADLAHAREVGNAVQGEAAKRANSALRESQAQLALIVEHSSDVIIHVGLDNIMSYVSPAVERMLGWRPEEMVGSTALRGSRPEDFVHPDDREVLLRTREALKTDSAGEASVSFRHLRSDGSWLWVDGRARLHMSAEGTGGPTGYVVALRDATDRKMTEIKLEAALEQMERMATTDSMTGLSNRRHFDVVADEEWRRCAREDQPLSVLLLDADHFKLFNDRYGHLAGDGCLCAIASQMAAAARRPADLAARYGGEEFLLLMPLADAVGAQCVAERVRQLVLNLAIAHEGSPASVVTVSIGVATAWPNGRENGPKTVSALLSAADTALYQAKSGGRNRVVLAGQ